MTDNPTLVELWNPVLIASLEGTALIGVVPRLPALSDPEWRNILLHEFAHRRRQDPLTNAWMILAGMVHWFNPLVAWAIRRMRLDRELACDQLVLARERLNYTGGAPRRFPSPTATTRSTTGGNGMRMFRS